MVLHVIRHRASPVSGMCLKILFPPCWLIFYSLSQIALEELAEKVNGDMRMAVNQLQYMSLSMSVIKYDDVRQRLLSSSKDEDISPFTAVDKYGSKVLFLTLVLCILLSFESLICLSPLFHMHFEFSKLGFLIDICITIWVVWTMFWASLLCSQLYT